MPPKRKRSSSGGAPSSCGSGKKSGDSAKRTRANSIDKKKKKCSTLPVGQQCSSLMQKFLDEISTLASRKRGKFSKVDKNIVLPLLIGISYRLVTELHNRMNKIHKEVKQQIVQEIFYIAIVLAAISESASAYLVSADRQILDKFVSLTPISFSETQSVSQLESLQTECDDVVAGQANVHVNTVNNSERLGRAIISIACAALESLCSLVKILPNSWEGNVRNKGRKGTDILVHSKGEKLLCAQALWSSLSALEKLVTLSISGSNSNRYIGGTSFQVDFMKNIDWSGDDWTSALTMVEALFQDDEKHDFNMILDLVRINESGNGKQITPQHVISFCVGLEKKAFEESGNLGHESEIIDPSQCGLYIPSNSSIPIRRWGSIAFVWLSRGQLRSLEALIEILSSNIFLALFGERPSGMHTVSLNVPANVARIIYCTRIMELVSDSSNCIRSSWQTKESFIKRSLATMNKKNNSTSKRREGATTRQQHISNINENVTYSPISLNRPSISFLSLRLLRLILLNHTVCLNENIAYQKELNPMINVGSSGDCPTKATDTIESLVHIYPWLHYTLINFAKTVGSSFNMSSSERTNHSFRFASLAAAFYLDQVSEKGFVDTRLISYVSEKLFELIPKIETSLDSETYSRYECKDLDLDSPVELSGCDDALNNNAFGNVFSASLNSSDPSLEILALYVRVMNRYRADRQFSPKSKKCRITKSEVKDLSQTTMFIRRLLFIVELCYNYFRELNSDKRELFLRIANDVTLFMSHLIRVRGENRQISILHQFRKSVDVYFVNKIITIGTSLNDILVSNRSKNYQHPSQVASKNESPVFATRPKSQEYTQYERRLWTSHIKLCLSLARGQPSFIPERLLDDSPILDRDLRLEICRALSSDVKLTDSNLSLWPLGLPLIHHALISANISSEPVPLDPVYLSPERYILNGFIGSLEKRSRCSQNKMDRVECFTCHDLLINDARLLVLCLIRLPSKEQLGILSRLISSIDILKQLSTDSNALAFTARLLILICSMVDAIGKESHGFKAIISSVGSTIYRLPVLPTSSNRESSFTELFPDSDANRDTMKLIEPEHIAFSQILIKLNNVYRVGIDLGFRSAPRDRCYLLFVSWNACGKLYLSDPEHKWCGWSFSDQPESSSMLIALRNDVSSFRNILESDFRFKMKENVDSVKNCHAFINRDFLKGGLTRAKTCLNICFTNIRCTDSLKGYEVAREFSLVESLIVFISFLTSHHTVDTEAVFDCYGDKNDESKTRPSKRVRGISDDTFDSGPGDGASSDDSEAGLSDDDEEENDRIDALGRYQDICFELGFSPTHPDWLDKSCRFREGVTCEEAGLFANEAMIVLSNLGKVALDELESALQRAITVTSKNITSKQAKNIVRLRASQISSSARKIKRKSLDKLNVDIDSYLASLCQTDQKVFSKIFDDVATYDDEYIATREARLPNAIMKIRRKMQELGFNIEGLELTNAEMRAMGEWDLLFADCLLGAMRQHPSESAIMTGKDIIENKNEIHREIQIAGHWNRVLIRIVDALVSITSLLNFSLNNGEGRERIYNMKQDENRLRSHVLFQNSIHVRKELSKASCNCILLMSSIENIPLSGSNGLNNTCQMVMFNLCNSLATIINIERLGRTKCLLESLQIVDKIDFQDIETKGKLLELILLGIINFADGVSLEGKADRSITTNCTNFSNETMYESESNSILQAFLTQPRKNPALLFTHNNFMNNFLQEGLAHDLIKFFSSKVVDNTLSGELRFSFFQVIVSVFERFKPGKAQVSNELVVDFWDHMSSSKFRATLLSDILYFVRGDRKSNDYAAALCRIWAKFFRILVETLDSPNEECKELLTAILDCMKDWSKVDSLSREHVFCLVIFLAHNSSSMHEIIDKMLHILHCESNNIGYFLAFEDLLRQIYNFYDYPKNSMESVKFNGGQSGEKYCENALGLGLGVLGIKDILLPQQTCSFVETRGEFTEQYWYNCYTCGLLRDKGCCSLCALVCHKGHDLRYSRRSSFFCDCGAETESNPNLARPPCKCLHPLSERETTFLNEINAGQKANEYTSQSPLNCSSPMKLDASINMAIDLQCDSGGYELLFKLCSIFANCFQRLTSSANTHSLFDMIGFSESKHENEQVHLELSEIPLSRVFEQKLSFRVKHDIYDKTYCVRNGKKLHITKAGGLFFKPLCSFKTSSLKIDNSFRLGSTSKFIAHNSMVIDSRGKGIIAESNTLTFCNLLPVVNLRHSETIPVLTLERSQLYVLGKSKVKFEIVGMALCEANHRLLLIWGASEVCVVVLNQICNVIDVTIDLMVDLEPHECETEYLLKCEWLSPSHVICVCGTFVKAFDLRGSTSLLGSKKEFSLKSSTCYSLAYEDVLVRSAVLINNSMNSVFKPCQSFPEGTNEFDSTFIRAQLVILLDNGRLLSTCIAVDCNGDYEDQGDIYIECGDGLRFPLEGVRRYSGAQPSPKGTTSNSLGEGSSLFYCKQSDLLLYKCTGSPVIAMKFNENKIVGSFELLPTSLKLDCFESDEVTFQQPYTHWTELGTFTKDNLKTYRLACVARSVVDDRSIVVIIEFNDDYVVVNRLGLSTATKSFAIDSSHLVEGLAIFSTPYLANGNNDGFYCDSSSSVKDRLVLSITLSNGSVSFYGEDISHDIQIESDSVADASDDTFSHSFRKIQLPPTRFTQKPYFPPHIFEYLDLCKPEEYIITGDAVSSELDPKIVKQKLSIDNNSDFISCSNRGCTISISLITAGVPSETSIHSLNAEAHYQHTSEIEIGNSSSGRLLPPLAGNPLIYRKNMSKSHAIVAIRLLLGKNGTDFPRSIFVMGRCVKTIPCQERWYDLPLTDEEVILGVRSGCVSIGLGRVHQESNQSIIHSMEVYTRERDSLHLLNPYQNSIHQCYQHKSTLTENGPMSNHCNLDIDIIFSGARSLSIMCNIYKRELHESNMAKDMLYRLVEMTASGNYNVRKRRHDIIRLLESCDINDAERRVLIDKGTMMGVLQLFDRIKNDLSGVLSKSDRGANFSSMLIFSILSTLHQSLQLLLEIISERPDTYRAALEEMHENKCLNESFVSKAEKILREVEKSTVTSYHHKRSHSISNSIENKSKSIDSSNFDVVRCSLIEIAVHELHVQSKVTESKYLTNIYTDIRILGKLIKFGDEKSVNILSSIISPSRRISKDIDSLVHTELASGTEVLRERMLSPPMAYRCDGCHIFPITVMRYTLEEFDIDLCRLCYHAGKEFSSLKSQIPHTPVQIHGHALLMSNGSSVQVSHINQMKAVAVEKLAEQDFEQVKQNIVCGITANSLNPHDNLPVKCKSESSDVLRLSTIYDEKRSVKVVTSNFSSLHDKIDNLIKLTDSIFHTLLTELISTVFLTEEKLDKLTFPSCAAKGAKNLMKALVAIIQFSDNDKKVEWGEKFATDVSQALSQTMLKTETASNNLENSLLISLVLGLNALESLISLEIKQSISKSVNVSRKCSKTHPSYACNHGVPAVRRKCSQGMHKNRRFYVCGMKRSERCQYFKWADKDYEQAKKLHFHEYQNFAESIESMLRDLFCSVHDGDNGSLQSRLCALLEKCQSAQENQKIPVLMEGTNVDSNEVSQMSSILQEIQNISIISQDFSDGVFLSKTRLESSFEVGLFKREEKESLRQNQVSDQSIFSLLIQSALDLLSQIASNDLETNSMIISQSLWDKGWFNLLCSIISTTSASPHQQQLKAKRMLKRLCGGRKLVYHSVRDYHVFAIQYSSLLCYCKKILDDAFYVKEKARMCGSRWKETPLSWENMKAGDLLGLEGLLSENSFPFDVDENVNTILNDLIESAKTRCTNWRQFCITSESPIVCNSGSNGMKSAPFIGLVWMACCLPGRCQVKILQLIDVALNEVESKSTNVVQENDEGLVRDDEQFPFFAEEDIVSFVVQFILHGRTSELRRISFKVASKLLNGLSKVTIMSVMEKLSRISLNLINTLGDSSSEFFALLNYAIYEYGKGEEFYLRNISKIIFPACLNQLTLIGPRMNEEAVCAVDSSDNFEESNFSFDLSSCRYCSYRAGTKVQKTKYFFCCNSNPCKKSKSCPVVSMENPHLENSYRVIRKEVFEASSQHDQTWVTSQIRPFSKTRLDASTAHFVSTEFAMYAQLKHRFAISEFHVNIQDPRGRHVKSIAISFTPRQVSNSTELRSEGYSSLWQRCGTITLGRGMSKNSFRMQTPIIAANIKFEYLEFFSNSGGIKGEETGILSCPRCARVVNNAAGVCGHCGEVAFQCRKCRHINYDRLDAFLCVECGYCASGHFSYDMTAGMASSATAITNDSDYERAGKLLRLSSKRLVDSRNELRRKLLSKLVSKRKRNDNKMEDMNAYAEYPPLLRKSFFGEIFKLNSEGKKRKSSTEQEETSKRTTQQRARSLLNLAHQLRSDTERIQENRAVRGDLLVRQAFLNATSASGLEIFEDDIGGIGEVERDIFAMLGGGSSSLLQSDISGSLSRIVASIQSRNRAEASLLDAAGSTMHAAPEDRVEHIDDQVEEKEANRTSKRKPTNSNREFLKECSVLYDALKESDNECYELQRTISAWERLNSDSLSDFDIDSISSNFLKPTFCSKCNIPVALNMLSLVISILQANPSVVTEEELCDKFMSQLFYRLTSTNFIHNKNMREVERMKQVVILKIAIFSEIGSDLVLNELRERLRLTRQEDQEFADILGILTSKSKSEKFASLAADILNGI